MFNIILHKLAKVISFQKKSSFEKPGWLNTLSNQLQYQEASPSVLFSHWCSETSLKFCLTGL